MFGPVFGHTQLSLAPPARPTYDSSALPALRGISPMHVTGILETALHVDDLSRAIAFYQGLFGFEVMAQDQRFCAFNAAGRDVLLIFKWGASTKTMQVASGVSRRRGNEGT